MTARPTHVAVVGGYEVGDAVLADAEAVGRRLAEAGAVLVTGGRHGVSAAACRGAREAGGLTVGILPGADRSEANEWVEVAVATGIGLTRNALVAMNGDAVIALDGAAGTLSEVAHALLLGRPVVALGAWDLAAAGLPAADAAHVHRATTPKRAVTLALDLAIAETP